MVGDVLVVVEFKCVFFDFGLILMYIYVVKVGIVGCFSSCFFGVFVVYMFYGYVFGGYYFGCLKE